jgi:hypothetical protein
VTRFFGRSLVLLAVLNFVAFWYASLALGGDALNGKSEGGRYYLADHGRLTEVSEGRFRYSQWHSRSLFLTHPLGIIASMALYASGDPWLTRRNRKRDITIMALVGVSIGVAIIGGPRTDSVPLVVGPILILGGLILDLRDASLDAGDVPRAAREAGAAEQRDEADKVRW